MFTFYTPWKHQNTKVSWCLQVVKNGNIGQKGVKHEHVIVSCDAFYIITCGHCCTSRISISRITAVLVESWFELVAKPDLEYTRGPAMNQQWIYQRSISLIRLSTSHFFLFFFLFSFLRIVIFIFFRNLLFFSFFFFVSIKDIVCNYRDHVALTL